MSTASVVKHHINNKTDQPRQKRYKVGKACFTCRVKKIKVGVTVKKKNKENKMLIMYN